MKTLRLAAAMALVSSVFALSASADTNDWWNVDFESPTPTTNVDIEGSVLGNLTNALNNGRPYTNGVWSAVDGDESYVTNSYNPTNSFGSSYCLRLDTQGNDLTWKPDDPTNGVKNLVDADLFLVGSDSEPQKEDFDSAKDVQAAIYLKNYVDDAGTGDTTNSVLCLYTYDLNIGSNAWLELDGVELADNAWAHIQVQIDHSGTDPMVSVKVNGTQMHARGDATATEWRAANYSTIGAAVTSVAFRGTGAVDNFVGTTVDPLKLSFTAQAFVDNNLQGTDATFNPTVTLQGQVINPGSTTTFTGFTIDNYDVTTDTDATYALSRIVIYNPDGTVLQTINYSDYDGENIDITPDVDDTAYFTWALDENDYRTGGFSVTVPTATATIANDGAVLAKIYFTSFNAPTTPDPVDPGQSMSAAEKVQYVPAGVVTETDDQTGVTTTSFVVHFKGVAGVTYELLSSTTLTLTDEQWKAATVEDTVVCTSANEDDVLELKVELDPNDTAKFFKIGASATQP